MFVASKKRMTDPEFNEKVKEYRNKIAYLIEYGVFDLAPGSATINFKPNGEIQDIEIRRRFAPEKKT